MSASIYLLTLCLPLGALIIIFAMRAFASTQQAKARLASEEALASIQSAIEDVRARLVSIETILKDVG